ncbi:MAG: hypothetical protein ACR2JK_12885 [Geodermatophilaceae bacterium]
MKTTPDSVSAKVNVAVVAVVGFVTEAVPVGAGGASRSIVKVVETLVVAPVPLVPTVRAVKLPLAGSSWRRRRRSSSSCRWG